MIICLFYPFMFSCEVSVKNILPTLLHFSLCYWILDFYIAWTPILCQIHVLPVCGLNVHFLSGVIWWITILILVKPNLSILQNERREKMELRQYLKKQADNFPNLLKDRNPHIQKLKISKKKPTFRYNIEKLQNIKDKEKKKLSWNVGQGKCRFPQRRSRLTADFSQKWWHLEGREMSSSLQQRNNHYPEILY